MRVLIILFFLPPIYFSAQSVEKIGSDFQATSGKINIRGSLIDTVRSQSWVWDNPKPLHGQITSLTDSELKIELRYFGGSTPIDINKISVIINDKTIPISTLGNALVDHRTLKATIFILKEGDNKIEILYESALSEPLRIKYFKTSPRSDLAVFFPVTTYSNSWQPLTETLPECQAIAYDLERIYGFSTIIENNSNKDQIKEKLAELATRTYSSKDQLLLFFSMHGYFDEQGNVGCLVPFGALENDLTFKTWLLHDELRALISRIPCQHILICLDACYSGTFSGSRSKPDGHTGNNCTEKIASTLTERTRLYITSGGKEKVPAASEFARLWRSALGTRGGEDNLLTFPELLSKLNEATPTPRWGEFNGHLGGGFVFITKNACNP